MSQLHSQNDKTTMHLFFKDTLLDILSHSHERILSAIDYLKFALHPYELQ